MTAKKCISKILSTLSSRQEIRVSDRATIFNLMIGLDGYTISTGIVSDELDPEIVPFEAPGPGWLCVCSDGLWNYASAPEALAEIVAACRAEAGDEPVALAEALVAWANGRGGQDNITVALIRLGDPTKG